MAFPKKNSVSGQFSSLPPSPAPPPRKNANFMFIVVSPSLIFSSDSRESSETCDSQFVRCLETRFAKKRVRFGNPETQTIRANLRIDSRETAPKQSRTGLKGIFFETPEPVARLFRTGELRTHPTPYRAPKWEIREIPFFGTQKGTSGGPLLEPFK